MATKRKKKKSPIPVDMFIAKVFTFTRDGKHVPVDKDHLRITPAHDELLCQQIEAGSRGALEFADYAVGGIHFAMTHAANPKMRVGAIFYEHYVMDIAGDDQVTTELAYVGSIQRLDEGVKMDKIWLNPKFAPAMDYENTRILVNVRDDGKHDMTTFVDGRYDGRRTLEDLRKLHKEMWGDDGLSS